uniref:Uncharacterized protein n=1 Tax=Timema monikensis TaxID=170555 RepID=A0A7R9HKL1_9NEOP|nr:unnamed protein product [Timema monikensis]
MDQSQQNMNMSALVVGNPSVPCSVTEQWGWGAIPYAEQEAAMATKEAVLHQIGEAQCVHLATHVSWKLSAIVLSPGNMVDSQQPKRFFSSSSDQGHDPTDEESSENKIIEIQGI